MTTIHGTPIYGTLGKQKTKSPPALTLWTSVLARRDATENKWTEGGSKSWYGTGSSHHRGFQKEVASRRKKAVQKSFTRGVRLRLRV